ncbi:MAG TPA: S8 family serine peptidase [Planctomycetota bacterium]|nr:S8 family serine peptidase [Planctomycetota bacterium]
MAMASWCSAADGKQHVLMMDGQRTVFTPLADQYVVCFTEEPAGGANPKLGIQGAGWGEIRTEAHTRMKIVRAGGGVKNVAESLKAVGKTRYLAPLYSQDGETVAIIPEVGVRLKNGHDRKAFDAFCQANGFTIIRPLLFTEQEFLLDPGAQDADGVFEAAQKLSTAPGVEWAVPNIAFQPQLLGPITPNDPFYPSQWHLNNTGQSGGVADADIDAPEAWEISTGSPSIVVAVLDEGIDVDHPDLIPNLVPGYDFYGDDSNPDPTTNGEAHGTACAGLVAAKGNNSIGVAGTAYNCKIMPIRIAAEAGFITEARIADAFRWAAERGAHVMTNSWGKQSASSSILYSAIKDVTANGRGGKGCVVLFASGNSNSFVGWPARYPEVIAVGAVDKRNQRCSYSNYGAELDLVAPSGMADLWTTDVLGQAGLNNSNTSILDYTDKMNGTSGACPIAAGVAALVLSVSPGLNALQVQDLLQNTADDLGAPGRDNYYGYGRVNAYAALSGQAGRFIIVQTPNGGEAFEAGTIVTISWTARGGSWVPTDTVRIEYSSNNGAVWTPILGAMSISYAARTFDWITGGMLPSDSYLIRITALADASASDRSDAAFTITGPLHHFDFVMDPSQTNTWPVQGVCSVTAKDSAGLTITTFATANTAGRFPVTISAPGVTVTGLPGAGGRQLPATSFTNGVADVTALGMKIATATPPVTVPFTATSADGKSGTSGDVAITPIGPPGPPMLPNPANLATGVPVDTNLAWFPAISIAVETYDVYFGQNNPPTALIYKDLAALTCDPTKIAGQSLDYSTTYYWKVIARNPEGETEGPVWSFTTGPPDVLHHFKWAPIPSPQQTGVPFPVMITAQDAANNLVSTFDGKVAITAVAEVTDDIQIGDQALSWAYPMDTGSHDARTQVIYLAGQMGGPRRIRAVSLYVRTPPTLTLTNWTIRMKHTVLDSYSIEPEWETGWTTVYQMNETVIATGWVTFVFNETLEFVYNGVDNLMVDFSFNNDDWDYEGVCWASLAGNYRTIARSTDSAFGDPLTWIGKGNTPQVPAPIRYDRIPNIRFSGNAVVNLLVMPDEADGFVGGEWRGMLTIYTPASNVKLTANDGKGHKGESNVFDVVGPPPPPPAAPTNLAAIGRTLDSITWSWQDWATNEMGFYGYDQYDKKDWEAPGANVTTYTETGLSTNTAYTRRVRAYHPMGVSTPSNYATAHTAIEPSDGPQFGAIGQTFIDVMSANTPTNLTSGYSGLMIRNTTKSTDSGWKKNNNYWTSGSLSPNTEYAFSVQSRNGDGIETPESSTGTRCTLPADPALTCNRTPGNAAHPAGSTFVFTNEAGWGPGSLHRYIYSWDHDRDYSFTGSEAAWTSGGLSVAAPEPGVWYLHVQTRNSANAPGNSLTSGPYHTLSAPVPANPAPAGSCTTVTWDAVTGAEMYLVEYDTDDSFDSPDADSGWIMGTSHQFCGLPGGTISYRVKAQMTTIGTSDSWTQTSRGEFESGSLTSTTATDAGDVTLGPGMNTIVSDDFEDGNFDEWENGTGTCTRQISTTTAAGGTHSFTIIGGSGHYGGISRTLAAMTPDRIDFHVRSGNATRTGAYVVIGTGPYTSQTAVNFCMRSNGTMGLYANTQWYTTACVASRWFHVTLTLNWTTKKIDYYVDGRLIRAAVPFAGPTITEVTAIWLYNLDDMQGWWDDISFSQLPPGTYTSAGAITSPAITPDVFHRWKSLTYSATASAGTTLTLDVLDDSGAVLAADVPSGADLWALNVTAAPINLRANMASSDVAKTSVLHDWGIVWESEAGILIESAWSTIVHSSQDGTVPTVTGYSLADDTGPDPGDQITYDSTPVLTFTFSEPVWGHDGDVAVTQPDDTAVVPDSILGWGTASLTVTFTTPLRQRGRYTVTLQAAGITNASGKLLNDGTDETRFFALALPIPGDADGSCIVNILDLIFVRARMGKSVDTGDNWRADVNEDRLINILDLIYVRARLNTRCN